MYKPHPGYFDRTLFTQCTVLVSSKSICERQPTAYKELSPIIVMQILSRHFVSFLEKLCKKINFT